MKKDKYDIYREIIECLGDASESSEECEAKLEELTRELNHSIAEESLDIFREEFHHNIRRRAKG